MSFWQSHLRFWVIYRQFTSGNKTSIGITILSRNKTLSGNRIRRFSEIELAPSNLVSVSQVDPSPISTTL